jgi:hypothetical protein
MEPGILYNYHDSRSDHYGLGGLGLDTHRAPSDMRGVRPDGGSVVGGNAPPGSEVPIYDLLHASTWVNPLLHTLCVGRPTSNRSASRIAMHSPRSSRG